MSDVMQVATLGPVPHRPCPSPEDEPTEGDPDSQAGCFPPQGGNTGPDGISPAYEVTPALTVSGGRWASPVRPNTAGEW